MLGGVETATNVASREAKTAHGPDCAGPRRRKAKRRRARTARARTAPGPNRAAPRRRNGADPKRRGKRPSGGAFPRPFNKEEQRHDRLEETSMPPGPIREIGVHRRSN